MSSIRTSSGQNAIAGIAGRDAGGTLRTFVGASVRDAGNVPRSVLTGTGGGAGSQSLTPSYVQGSGNSKGSIFVSTTYATVNAPTGATFVWNFTQPGWEAINPTAPSTAFRARVAPGDDSETQVTCTVTANGNSYTTNAITAYVQNTNGGLN